MKEKIIFVYNADSGIVNALKDTVEKALHPDQYQCRLCSLTFGKVRIKSEWKRFINELPKKTQFLHRDEFINRFGDPGTGFPAAFTVEGSRDRKPALLLTPEEINSCQNVQDLKELVEEQLPH
jgi:hypothetical protein